MWFVFQPEKDELRNQQQEDNWKDFHMWKLNNEHLNDVWVREEFPEKIKDL